MVFLKITDVRAFMSNLLIKDGFDFFCLSELEIQTANLYRISGRLHSGWFTREETQMLEGRRYSIWKELKPLAFQLIKGEKTPLSMKLVFLLDENRKAEILAQAGNSFQPDQIEGLFMNLKYENSELSLVTGTSVRLFTLDKTLELEWDRYVIQYLKKIGIAFETISTHLS